MKLTKKSKVIANTEQVDIRDFDLASPEHRIGALQSIIDNIGKQFERLARHSFHHMLRQSTDFKLVQQDTLKLQEYLQQMKKPSIYREFMVSPHDLHGTIAMDGELLFFMVDLFFGGNGLSARKHSELSDTELRLVERFFTTILQQFSTSWHSITDWQSQLLSKNTLNLFSPLQNNQLYQVCRFTIDIAGQKSGWLEIALPFAGLDFLRDQQCQPANVDTDPALQAKIQQKICQAPIRLHSTLAERRLLLGQIMDLKPGDVIPIELPEQVTVRAGSTPLFEARVAEHNASLVLHIQQILNPSKV
ncbi:flagellar motor switch protein FliM [Photobacterium aphoticum]|uniref:Flagellar motor switch protein FliM n=1 Tax=Photobacterium aphoticum TaxID=754436 RepID=A0A0J1GLZ0_9GAMM|nr:FliM/FliN family flagellar motor switch protein [Photobacterium aphoticum]KLV00636.1 flagellar motor switch protein FliM [Photobacterium aphoticum]PSU51934.1 flagellar motor switch protein FliM [Photobacterium aphoticum]GHA58864.1 flagellar motor switch protein FliM [Photobacterium aphoticum]